MSYERIAERLRQIGEKSRCRELVPRTCDGIHLIQQDGRKLINFGGNDYLGLAAERHVSPIATGSMASALVCGWTDQHQQLADRLAELESAEATCLFPTGFAACMGTVSTLAGPNDLILSDQLNHASLIDGCRLSPSDCVIYPHRDVDFVEQTLKQGRTNYSSVWIVTDGVFSMDGHVAPLQELAVLAEGFGATLIVDEAHGTGVLGESGSGVCEALGVKSRVSIRIGTLSKAFGGQGGFVAGPQVVVDYLVNRSRALIYSTALAPSAVASAIEAIDCITAEPDRRQRVKSLAQALRRQLSIQSANEIEATIPIVPVTIGSDHAAITASERLAGAGFFVPAIRPPTVPEGTARLRISLSAAHDESMIEELSAAIKNNESF